jgi:hypothetical protein
MLPQPAPLCRSIACARVAEEQTAAKKPRATNAAGKKNVETAPEKKKAVRKSPAKSSRRAR